LEETREQYLNKFIKTSRPEVERYYKKYVDNFVPIYKKDENFMNNCDRIDKALENKKEHVYTVKEKKENAKKIKEQYQKAFNENCKESLSKQQQEEYENSMKTKRINDTFVKHNNTILEEKRKKEEKVMALKQKEKEEHSTRLKELKEREENEKMQIIKTKPNLVNRNVDPKFVEKNSFEMIKRSYKNQSQITFGDARSKSFIF